MIRVGPSPRRPQRTIGPRGAAGFVVGAVASLIVAAGVLVAPRRAVDTSRVVDQALQAWGRCWMWALRARVQVVGLENLTPGGRYVIVANHQSALDPMAILACLPLPVRFLAKAELFRLPLIGTAMRRAGMVAVNRAAVDAEGITTGARRVLTAGRSLLVFPEGTVSQDGRLLPFKSGAFAIAHAHAVPILPVAIDGTRFAWPVGRGRLVPKLVTVRVVIGAPIPTAGLSRRDLASVRARARQMISMVVERPQAPGQLPAGGSGNRRVGSTVSTTPPSSPRSTR